MTGQSIQDVRKKFHTSQAHLWLYLYRDGTALAKANGYGELEGLEAIARYLLERDGTPIERTLSASYDSLMIQLEGALPKSSKTPAKVEPGTLEEATMQLLLTQGELATLLEQFGDELGERETLDVDGLDAIRIYLMHKHGFELSMLESLSPTALRKYMTKEMKDWTA